MAGMFGRKKRNNLVKFITVTVFSTFIIILMVMSKWLKQSKLRANFCTSTLPKVSAHPVMEIIKQYPKNMPVTFLDVGANVGLLSLAASYCLTQKPRVFAVEPVKKNHEKIVKVAERLTGVSGMATNSYHAGTLSISRVAFSNESGTTHLYVPLQRSDNAALSREASTGNLVRNGMKEESVDMLRADHFLNNFRGIVNLIKIDVQGSELKVLQGMEKILAERNVIVIAEWDPKLMKLSGFERWDVWDFMTKLNFEGFCYPSFSFKNKRLYIHGRALTKEEVYGKMNTSVQCLGRDVVFGRQN